MEYHLTKQTIRQPACVLDTAAEQSIDAEFTLPDYCPDIGKILSCTLLPQIYLANVSGDKLLVEGASRVNVLYLDGEDGKLRSYEYSAPFSTDFSLKEPPAECNIYAEAKPGYSYCRAVGPRKISLHGAFSLCVKAVSSAPQGYTVYEDDDDLQTQSRTISVVKLSGLCSERFTVKEDIPVNADVSTVLDHRISARITQLQAEDNKIKLSAELIPELLYLTDAEPTTPQRMSCTIPITRQIECTGVKEDAVIDADLSVMSCEVHLSDDALDGSSVLTSDVSLLFNAQCFDDEEITVLSDAFSTQMEVRLQTEPFSCLAQTACRTDTNVDKVKVETDDDIDTIMDVHCEKILSTFAVNDGVMTVQSKLSVGILYRSGDGEMRCIERDATLTYQPAIEEGQQPEDLKTSVNSLSYRLTDDKGLELRAELCYRMTLTRRVNETAVTAVSADDDVPNNQQSDALILCYADGGDTVWDIAKRYASRPADIIAENELEDETLQEGRMLLIPTA